MSKKPFAENIQWYEKYQPEFKHAKQINEQDPSWFNGLWNKYYASEKFDSKSLVEQGVLNYFESECLSYLTDANYPQYGYKEKNRLKMLKNPLQWGIKKNDPFCLLSSLIRKTKDKDEKSATQLKEKIRSGDYVYIFFHYFLERFLTECASIIDLDWQENLAACLTEFYQAQKEQIDKDMDENFSSQFFEKVRKVNFTTSAIVAWMNQENSKAVSLAIAVLLWKALQGDLETLLFLRALFVPEQLTEDAKSELGASSLSNSSSSSISSSSLSFSSSLSSSSSSSLLSSSNSSSSSSSSSFTATAISLALAEIRKKASAITASQQESIKAALQKAFVTTNQKIQQKQAGDQPSAADYLFRGFCRDIGVTADGISPLDRNYITATTDLRRAAEMGATTTNYLLDRWLQEGGLIGHKDQENPTEALQYLDKFGKKVKGTKEEAFFHAAIVEREANNRSITPYQAAYIIAQHIALLEGTHNKRLQALTKFIQEKDKPDYAAQQTTLYTYLALAAEQGHIAKKAGLQRFAPDIDLAIKLYNIVAKGEVRDEDPLTFFQTRFFAYFRIKEKSKTVSKTQDNKEKAQGSIKDNNAEPADQKDLFQQIVDGFPINTSRDLQVFLEPQFAGVETRLDIDTAESNAIFTKLESSLKKWNTYPYRACDTLEQNCLQRFLEEKDGYFAKLKKGNDKQYTDLLLQICRRTELAYLFSASQPSRLATLLLNALKALPSEEKSTKQVQFYLALPKVVEVRKIYSQTDKEKALKELKAALATKFTKAASKIVGWSEQDHKENDFVETRYLKLAIAKILLDKDEAEGMTDRYFNDIGDQLKDLAEGDDATDMPELLVDYGRYKVLKKMFHTGKSAKDMAMEYAVIGELGFLHLLPKEHYSFPPLDEKYNHKERTNKIIQAYRARGGHSAVLAEFFEFYRDRIIELQNTKSHDIESKGTGSLSIKRLQGLPAITPDALTKAIEKIKNISKHDQILKKGYRNQNECLIILYSILREFISDINLQEPAIRQGFLDKIPKEKVEAKEEENSTKPDAQPSKPKSDSLTLTLYVVNPPTPTASLSKQNSFMSSSSSSSSSLSSSSASLTSSSFVSSASVAATSSLVSAPASSSLTSVPTTSSSSSSLTSLENSSSSMSISSSSSSASNSSSSVGSSSNSSSASSSSSSSSSSLSSLFSLVRPTDKLTNDNYTTAVTPPTSPASVLQNPTSQSQTPQSQTSTSASSPLSRLSVAGEGNRGEQARFKGKEPTGKISTQVKVFEEFARRNTLPSS